MQKRVYDYNAGTDGMITDVKYLDGFQTEERGSRMPVGALATQLSNNEQYARDILQFFPHPEGYVRATPLSKTPPYSYQYDYVYNYTDHLGNIRVSYTQDPVNKELKILEENHYYPFGLKHSLYTAGGKKDYQFDENDPEEIARPGFVTSIPYQYKYNGQEWQDELGLNMYDMDMRQYDPAIARWVVMDPVTHHSMSPYNAFDNNPVFWADPSGADAVYNWDKERYEDSNGNEVSFETAMASVGLNSDGTEKGDGEQRASQDNGDPYDKSKKETNKQEIGNARGTFNAIKHYYNGNGEPAEVGYEAKLGVIQSKRFKRVVNRLKKGIANEKSSEFGVNLTIYEFHVGRTNVEYNTSCTKENCTTIFKAFVNDGFRDPLDVGIEAGGTPYDYIPWEFSIDYENPGYPIGENIK